MVDGIVILPHGYWWHQQGGCWLCSYKIFWLKHQKGQLQLICFISPSSPYIERKVCILTYICTICIGLLSSFLKCHCWCRITFRVTGQFGWSSFHTGRILKSYDLWWDWRIRKIGFNIIFDTQCNTHQQRIPHQKLLKNERNTKMLQKHTSYKYGKRAIWIDAIWINNYLIPQIGITLYSTPHKLVWCIWVGSDAPPSKPGPKHGPAFTQTLMVSLILLNMSTGAYDNERWYLHFIFLCC